MKIDRIVGCLYGQVVGDALGTRYEFKNAKTVSKMIDNDIDGGFVPILGGGPFNLQEGQVTDDTEMAFALAQSILENKCYDKEQVALKYIKWINSDPFDIGNTIKRALSNADNYDHITRKADYNSLSNGCLMRISPLAIHCIFDSDKNLLKLCKKDCIMTNSNPIAINAVQVYAIAIKYAILTGNKMTAFTNALKWVKDPLIQNILTRAKMNNPTYILENGGIIRTADDDYIGYLGIALQMAFTELLHGNSFYNSMLNVVSKGGDTDTNCCIVGSLIGALYGKKHIPTNWINSVNMDNPRREKFPEINQQNISKIALRLSVVRFDDKEI
jgi:ADP-ribosyl-[dinitrogen reductase] hydrolase